MTALTNMVHMRDGPSEQKVISDSLDTRGMRDSRENVAMQTGLHRSATINLTFMKFAFLDLACLALGVSDQGQSGQEACI
jgi:hypothetical protein